MAARIGSRFAEIADEGLHLAAVVLDEGDDPLDALRFRLLAAVEALGQAIAELVERRRLLEQREALPNVGDLQLDESLLFEIAERGDDALAVLARHGLRIDTRPDAAFLA